MSTPSKPDKAPETSPTITIPRERLMRLVDGLAAVAIGDYSLEKIHIPVVDDQSEIAVFEEMFNVFAAEQKAITQKNAEYLKSVEQARAELEEKLATIERQRLAIRDLSTPIIGLWDGIVALPIVGVVDTHRSVEMTERLLRHIAQTRAKCVIIDITGVDVVDTGTANHFIRMIGAARFLGAYCVVTGISPDIAQTLTQLGVELRDVPTLRSMQEGFRRCLLYLRAHTTSTDQHLAATRLNSKTSDT